MANRIWNVESEGASHTVEADYSILSGARWIEVDGERVVEEPGGIENPGNFVEMGASSYQITIGERRGTVTFNLLRTGFDIEMSLTVEGEAID